jgi:hypothetical protein
MSTVNVYHGHRKVCQVGKYWCILAILDHFSMNFVPSSDDQYSCSLCGHGHLMETIPGHDLTMTDSDNKVKG